MKLSTLNSKLNLLSIGTNSKTSKGDGSEYLTAILYLSPSDLGGRGNVCKYATNSCKIHCLGPYSGRGVFSNVRRARDRKTQLFFDNNQEFMLQLYTDLNLFSKYCKENGIQGCVRFNGSSDLNIQKFKYLSKPIIEYYPDLLWYDYTKDLKRISKYKNYHLTYSYSENTTEEQLQTLIKNKKNIAVIFDELPSIWKGVTVINGDKDDLRCLDPQGVIVGLSPKGSLRKALKDGSHNGFIVETKQYKNRINLVNV